MGNLARRMEMKTLLKGIMLSIIGLFLCNTVLAEPLIEAIGHGDMDAVRQVLKKGGNVNAKGPGKTPALHLAISMGHIEIARLLIEKKANLETRDDMGSTAFMRPLTGRISS